MILLMAATLVHHRLPCTVRSPNRLSPSCGF